MNRRQKKKFARKFHNKKIPNMRLRKALKVVQDQIGNDKDIMVRFNKTHTSVCSIFMLEPDFEVPEKYKSEGYLLTGYNLYQCDKFEKCYQKTKFTK